MEIGLGLGFRMFIVTFRLGFDGLLFISLALSVAEAIVDFDRGESMLISPSNLTGHHEQNGWLRWISLCQGTMSTSLVHFNGGEWSVGRTGENVVVIKEFTGVEEDVEEGRGWVAVD